MPIMMRWAMYGRRPRCKGKESDLLRSVRVQPCIRPTCSNQRPDTLMQDRKADRSTKASCNARPDHTFGSKAVNLKLSITCPLYPQQRTSEPADHSSARAMYGRRPRCKG